MGLKLAPRHFAEITLDPLAREGQLVTLLAFPSGVDWLSLEQLDLVPECK